MADAPALRRLWRSDAGRSAGLGLALAIGQVLSLVFTIVFARVLGAGDFGELAALLASWLVLSVPGMALQAALARDVAAADEANDLPRAAAEVRRWTLAVVGMGAAASVLAGVGREPWAELLGVDDAWSAAATVPAAAAWALASVLRGALQGLAGYRAVALSIVLEAVGRLLVGAVLVALGLGVLGAFLGFLVAPLATSIALAAVAARRLPSPRGARPRLASPLAAAGAPVAATALLTALQNVDVVVVKREAADQAAGAFATASLVGKSVVWIAFGLGLFLLPEATRRLARSEPALRLFIQSAGLTLAAGVALTVLSLLAGGPLLELLFGSDYRSGGEILPELAIGGTLLALAWLAAQYLLAARRSAFLVALAAAAVAQPLAVAAAAPDLERVAWTLVALYGAALAVLALLLRASTSLADRSSS